jgi:hypothetical protein
MTTALFAAGGMTSCEVLVGIRLQHSESRVRLLYREGRFMKFMHIFPRNRQEWLAALLFPFKAYTVIAPLMYEIFFHLCDSYYRHYYPSDENAFVIMMMLMFPCSAILLFTALVLTLAGPKGTARSCVGFGIAALVLGYYLFPELAHA